LGVVVLYTGAVWHVCSQYTTAGWQQEKTALVQRALETTQQRQELAASIGTELDKRLSSMQSTQTTINQKVIREIIKEPVYTNCVTTPDGVRLIEDTIRNKGHSSTK
jgi:hypothetical protein